ncbi:efflux RND transporter periplasmic adaptor subunit [Acinetobacter sp. NIPH 2699]|uniref:efflux RND transporter periplasmic adaptor subunit n=1 Tax=Acinetobacter sp. NIPH 2699 TaxID=2923433 RepID=UPI001F4AB892|nr:efflux RND transporter periplasmic adaptor subunit [Acinetobacter sp. NIPH 2699]MCH7335803.1 efflux RND transporter periplasmic adaptor subunit [Acinetobacter sp. NIPH 2699]
MSINQKMRSQWVWIAIIVVVTVLLASVLLWNSKSKTTANTEHGEQGHSHQENEQDEHAHDEEGEEHDSEEGLSLSTAQMQQHSVKLAQVALGEVNQVQSFPAKLVVNTDRQAHVSPSFAGRVEAVYVELGQQVKRGQALANLLVPDLVDQQANLQIAQTNLDLAKQDYERERSLWSQGISAKQDEQRAYNAYRQAQIQVQAARSRLTAFGAGSGSNGRYTLTAPINGVISNKDIVIGENVQLADQLFIIDQLDQLWLEFILPTMANVSVQPNQQIHFKSLQTGNRFNAQVQSLTTEADAQTGRLQIRAKVSSNASELRPNLMVNVELQAGSKASVMRVSAEAIQQVEGKDVVFVAKSNQEKGFDFVAVPVQIGQRTQDGQWVEITQGLTAGQSYVATGSFLLKSELEKGEAEHGH